MSPETFPGRWMKRLDKEPFATEFEGLLLSAVDTCRRLC